MNGCGLSAKDYIQIKYFDCVIIYLQLTQYTYNARFQLNNY